jgi:predicted 3-demethylubiquinone-9 3-methyltransferase (glyoxalase superfamily)
MESRSSFEFLSLNFPWFKCAFRQKFESGSGTNIADSVCRSKISLFGSSFLGLESTFPHNFCFNEVVSLMRTLDNQVDIDLFWDKLSAVPEGEQ